MEAKYSQKSYKTIGVLVGHWRNGKTLEILGSCVLLWWVSVTPYSAKPQSSK